MKQTKWLLVAAVIIVLAGLTFNLSGYDLLDPDEGRNAEVAREMAETNDYILPHLNGLPYLDKPILFFFVDALGMEVLGPTVLAARLPALLFTLLTLCLVWWFAERAIGVGAGWVASLATASMPLTLAFSRTVIFDSTLTFFVVLSIIGFFLAGERPSDSSETPGGDTAYWWTVVAWSAMGLGVLTKGPIALVLPLLVAIPYALWQKNAKKIANPIALLSFATLLLPWIFAMTNRIPDFLEYSLLTETLARLTTDEMQRTGPLWYFIPILLTGSLPWSVVALGGLKKGIPSRDDQDRPFFIFLLLWILLPLLFFSLSQSKRPQYILPLLPGIGVLVAMIWYRTKGDLSGVRAASIALGILSLFFFVLAGALGTAFGATSGVAATIPGTGVGLGAVCLVSSVTLWFSAKNTRLSLLAMVLPVSAIPFVSTSLMDALGNDRSNANIAEVMERVLTEDTEVIAIETYPLSLPFYLRRTITLSTDNGAELTSNYLFRTLERWRGVPETTLRPADWWRERAAICDRPRLFVVKIQDTATRRLLESVLPILTANRKVAVYGPCNLTQLASTHPGSPPTLNN
jgi:4-amino-4-deoxy-L-arabinose transferase-like glycosyltransferase